MKNVLLLCCSLLVAIGIACQPAGQSTDKSELKPGDEINGMIVTTGAAEVPPLLAFCSPAQEKEGITTVDCHVPLVSRLAIGHPFEGPDQALQTLHWSARTWQLSLDRHPLDLDAFGFYTYVVPDLAPGPSPVREVFRQKKAWDVVLVHPTPGLHTLRGTARTGNNTFAWVVNFTVESSLAR
jgi:hypothetical protein